MDKEKNKKQSQKRKSLTETHDQGETPLDCPKFPNGMQSMFSKKKDQIYFVQCVYHREIARKQIGDLWEYKQTLINPETQALCKSCTDIFNTHHSTPNLLQLPCNQEITHPVPKLGYHLPSHPWT